MPEALTHQPKGGMCATCKRLHENCSALPFATMPVMQRINGVVIVRCTEYRREKEKT